MTWLHAADHNLAWRNPRRPLERDVLTDLDAAVLFRAQHDGSVSPDDQDSPEWAAAITGLLDSGPLVAEAGHPLGAGPADTPRPVHAVGRSAADPGTAAADSESRPARSARALRRAAAGGIGFAAALEADHPDRGWRIVRDTFGFGERAAAEFAHRPVLPLHRFRDARVHPARRHGLLVRGERAAGALARRLPGPRRARGRGRGLRGGLGRIGRGHGAGRQDPQGAHDRTARRLVGGLDDAGLLQARLGRPGRRGVLTELNKAFMQFRSSAASFPAWGKHAVLRGT
jgi:hypothetical protein